MSEKDSGTTIRYVMTLFLIAFCFGLTCWMLKFQSNYIINELKQPCTTEKVK